MQSILKFHIWISTQWLLPTHTALGFRLNATGRCATVASRAWPSDVVNSAGL